MIVSAYVPGLMDRSRFDRHDITFVSTAQDAIDAAATLVLVDLDRCDEPAAFRIDGAKVIGFGSHVDADRLAEAEAFGFDEVLPRSVFFRRLTEILGSP